MGAASRRLRSLWRYPTCGCSCFDFVVRDCCIWRLVGASAFLSTTWSSMHAWSNVAQVGHIFNSGPVRLLYALMYTQLGWLLAFSSFYYAAGPFILYTMWLLCTTA